MNLLSINHIQLNVEASTKDDVIQYISDLACKLHLVKDDVTFELKEREKEFPTAVGFGLAIPHAKSQKVAESSIIILKLANEVDWGNGELIKNVVSLLVPETSLNEHLVILSQIARKFIHEDFRNSLEAANDVETIYELFKAVGDENHG